MKCKCVDNVPAASRLVRAFPVPQKIAFAIALSMLSMSGFAQESPSPDSIVPLDEANVVETSVSTTESYGADGKSFSHAEGSAKTAIDWLQKMTTATAQLNFELAFVQTKANQETIPYLWRHGVFKEGNTMEQLSLLNGPGRELVRVGNVVSVFEPDAQPYSLHASYINGPIPSELLYSPNSLKLSYEFVMVGRARIAGRPAQQLRIVSRDHTRFSYQMWLDEKTGLLLRLDTLDLKGNLLEQIQVTSLSITDSPADYFSKINKDSLPQPLVLAPVSQRAHGWEVEYMPKGMVEVKHDIRRLALTGQVVEYKMFTDGLVNVSVYVQPAKDAIGADLVLRHDLNTFLTLTDGKAQVTVVGEIPLQTANTIATSLRVKDEGK